MVVRTYYLTQERGKALSPNLKLEEFACKDGSDAVLVDDGLVELLQKIRDYFGTPLNINSAYRSPAHNKKVGGSPKSQHLEGTAADIVLQGVTPLLVAQYAVSIQAGGVGLYKTFTHVDVRVSKARWDQRSGKQVVVAGFGSLPPDSRPAATATAGQPAATASTAPKQMKTRSSAASLVQSKAGLEDITIDYLEAYRFGKDLLEKLAKAIQQGGAQASAADPLALVQERAGLSSETMAYLQKYRFGKDLLEKLARAMQ